MALRNRGNGHFRGRGEQSPSFEGNMVTKTILGNREHEKTNFPTCTFCVCL